MRYLFILLLLCVACAQEEKRPTTANGRQLEDVLRQKPKTAADIVIWMKKCASECVVPDNLIAQDLAEGYETLFGIASAIKPTQPIDGEQKAKFIEAQRKVRSAFLKILQTKENRATLETAYRELVSPPYATYLDSELEKAMLGVIARLKAKPSTKATAYYLQAISIPPISDNILSIIASYKQCLEVSKYQDKECMDQYEDIVHFYERPRCQSEAFLPGLKFFEAQKEKTAKYKIPYSLMNKSYYAADKPVLSDADLLEATVELVGPGLWEIWFSLKTFSSEKFQALTEKGEKEKGVNLLMVKDKNPLAIASINQKIADGQFRMVFASEKLALSAFHQICKKSTPEKIPDNLKIK
jgi:hypothetical protein